MMDDDPEMNPRIFLFFMAMLALIVLAGQCSKIHAQAPQHRAFLPMVMGGANIPVTTTTSSSTTTSTLGSNVPIEWTLTAPQTLSKSQLPTTVNVIGTGFKPGLYMFAELVCAGGGTCYSPYVQGEVVSPVLARFTFTVQMFDGVPVPNSMLCYLANGEKQSEYRWIDLVP